MTEEPAKILDFFATARNARRDELIKQEVSPSREQPIFRRLYEKTNKPYRDSNELKNTNYDPQNDGPGAA
jgi:hypothetical protein